MRRLVKRCGLGTVRGRCAERSGCTLIETGLRRGSRIEGGRIPPVRLVRGGEIDRDLLRLVLLNVRTPAEREGDLAAQIGACKVGEQRLLQLVERYGVVRLQVLGEELLNYSERLVRAELRRLPSGKFEAEDWLDDDGVSDTPA